MSTFLETERLNLRPLAEEDADGPYPSWFNDPACCAGNSHHVYPYTRAQALDYIKAVRSDKSCIVLAIELKESKLHVGNVALQQIHAVHRSAELAIIIGDKSCRGKGIGREACQSLIHHGFSSLNLHRISCGTHAGNTAMRRIAEQLGFQQEGVCLQAAFKEGKYVDVILYGLLAANFSTR